MKLVSIVLCLLSSTLAFGGQTGGGGTTAKPLEQMVDMQEMMSVFKGASSISKEFYGVPDNFKLDMKNRVVSFEENFELTYEEVKNEAGLIEIPTRLIETSQD